MSSSGLDRVSGLASTVIAQQKLIVTVALLLAFSGALAFLSMDRQEDPFFPQRAARIVVPFPGADPARIERLVVNHIEEEVAQVEEVGKIYSTMRTGVALTTVELRDDIYDTQSAWERVRQAVARAQAKFPPQAGVPDIDDQLINTATVVLAVTGSGDVMRLAQAAEQLKARLLSLPDLQRVELVGDPGEQVTIALRDAVVRRVALPPAELARQLQSRNQIIPGGTLELADSTVVLTPETEFRSLDEIRATPIRLPAGDTVPLASLARVSLGPTEPAASRFFVDGARAVGVSLVSVPNATNQVAFGEVVIAAVSRVQQQFDASAEFADLQIETVYFQPDRVHKRLSDLSGNLLLAMAIILLVLFVFMGIRLGMVVAVVLPLVSAVTIAIYAMNGNVLHQIAVIGLIVALGILIDNAIVMVENIQWRINQGQSPRQAAAGSVRELIGPLGAATGTTLAAFVPLLLAKGGTADFTRAVPVTIMTALAISYVAAMTFTPVVASWFLKPQHKAADGFPERLGSFAGRLATRRAGMVFLGGALLVGGSVVMAGFVEAQFFPNADRNQIVIDFTLPEGTSVERTQAVAEQVEAELRGDSDTVAVHANIGETGPRFYYNLPSRPREPNRGRLVVETRGLDANVRLVRKVRAYALQALPDVELIAKQLAQGPPINSPIEVRVFHPDPKPLAIAVEQVYAALRTVPGAVDARHDLGVGVPVVNYAINDAVAVDYGLSRTDVAQALLGRSTGIRVGDYLAGDEPVPIRIRSAAGQRFDLAQLPAISIFSPLAGPVPLATLVVPRVAWQPAVIKHRDGRRVATVSSELDPDFVYTQVLADLQPKLDALDLPPGVELRFGGETETSGEANAAILTTAPFGLMLLLFFLLLQFNSFKRTAIVMMTVPLAAVGVIPGLVLTGSPFGFQPLLGIIALIGIVVNNAIVLIDVVDQRLADGADVPQAVRDAVTRRARPILLTTATTIAGLLPLAFSGTTLWPPMAWAIISGLTASAFLTLFIVPAACRLWLTAPPPAEAESPAELRHA
ncbi:efflux RND transporter permease subunit [bacterium]|nr:efflux RND transporter permease subunit [bacterium]